MSASIVHSQTPQAATLLITNAKVWTVDKQHPTAEAVAVIDDRIVAVGSSADLDRWRGPQTKILDAAGRLLLPGFNDSHVHFVDGGAQLDQVQLSNAPSEPEFVKRIAAQVKKTAKGEWVLGGDWDETLWTPAELPTKDVIDPVSADTPIFISRHDGHMALANSLAMKLAGVTAKTKDVPGGVIGRDPQGNPTGIFKDAAQQLIRKVIPAMTHEQRLRVIKRAMDYAASLGVTSVQHMNPEHADVAAYSELAERGELTTRIYAAPLETGWNDYARIGLRQAWGSSSLRLGALKGFADGSLGSKTAYMFEGFNDDLKNHGILSDEMHPVEAMRDRLTKADAAGLQICTHAIGDQAISIVLDIYEHIVKTNGERDRRLRIEHAQHMAAKDFDRFGKLHVIASVQPYQAIDDARFAEARIGHDRSSRTYAFRTFLDHGVRLAFGTDWDVVTLDPILTVYAAVTRAPLDGKSPEGWFPEQKLTVAEAVEAYTMGSAYAEFQEREKGSITPGKLADMVILSDDIFKIRPELIRNVKVETTILGGKIIYGGPPAQ
jgi:predicted amidohydrolase YtcJ